MPTAGNWVAAAVILGPLLWRKTASWRHERKQRTAQEQRRSDGTGPLQQQLAGLGLWSTRPSNILLLAAAALLVYEHTTALLLPSQHLFRTDLFLALGLGSTNVPMVFLRAKASALPFDNVAWKAEWGEEGLETLLRRLSSFEGRKLHLMLGIEPFAACTFCTQGKDYVFFALVRRLGAYSIALALFGFLTMRHDALDIIDETFFSLLEIAFGRDWRPKASVAKPSGNLVAKLAHDAIILRQDRHNWRRRIVYVLLAFAGAEAAVHMGLYDVSFGAGRWDHWHANVTLAWHIVLLSMSIVVLASPETPQVHPIHDIVRLAQQARRHTDETLAQVQGMHLTQQVLWGDPGLRAQVGDWHDTREATLAARVSASELARLSQQAGPAATGLRPDALHAVQQSSREAAANIWFNAARNWERAGVAADASSAPSQTEDGSTHRGARPDAAVPASSSPSPPRPSIPRSSSAAAQAASALAPASVPQQASAAAAADSPKTNPSSPPAKTRDESLPPPPS